MLIVKEEGKGKPERRCIFLIVLQPSEFVTSWRPLGALGLKMDAIANQAKEFKLERSE